MFRFLYIFISYIYNSLHIPITNYVIFIFDRYCNNTCHFLLSKVGNLGDLRAKVMLWTITEKCSFLISSHFHLYFSAFMITWESYKTILTIDFSKTLLNLLAVSCVLDFSATFMIFFFKVYYLWLLSELDFLLNYLSLWLLFICVNVM